MKYGMCSTWKKGMKIEDIIQFAADVGLEGVEICDGHIDEFVSRNGCGVEKLKELLDSKGLKCYTIAPYFSFLEKSKADESVICAKKCIDYAKKLGAGVIRTFIGSKCSRNLSENEWSMIGEYLSKLGELGEKDGISFAVETHNGHASDTYKAMLRMLEASNSEYVKVLFDGYNYLPDGLDMMEAYDALEPYTIHYHIKNYRFEGDNRIPTTLDKGAVDFEPLIKRMKQKGYNGFISFEYFCDGLDDIIRKSVEWVNNV